MGASAEAEFKRFQGAVEPILRRVVAGIYGGQHFRAGRADSGGELFDTHGADHLPERDLQIDACVDRGQQELPCERQVAKVRCEADAPVFTLLLPWRWPS